MKAYIYHGPGGWYWRNETTMQCGPFANPGEATADALRMDMPAAEFFGSQT